MDVDQAVAPFRERPQDAAVFTDYDGTVAPIVADPDAAVPLPSAAAVLSRVAERMGLLVVVSGRPVAWLARQLGQVPRIVLVGLYGLERLEGGEVIEAPEAGLWRPVVEEAAAAAEAAAPPGVLVERKGLSVALHVRTAPRHEGWMDLWSSDQAERTGLVAHAGRRSVELRPPLAIDKGTVVASLAAGYRAVCFIGDDLGDVAAFDALRRLGATGVHTVAAAVASDEAPPELLGRADLVVDGPPGVLDLLARLSG
jgi:trehalose 6-phosphate phosphatase